MKETERLRSVGGGFFSDLDLKVFSIVLELKLQQRI